MISTMRWRVGCGGVFGIEEECYLTVGDCSPVFHSAGGEVGDGEMVELFQGIGDAEIVVVILQETNGGIEGKLAEMLIASGSEDTHEGTVRCGGFNTGEVTDDEGQEIGGHARSFCERDGLEAIARVGLTYRRECWIRR